MRTTPHGAALHGAGHRATRVVVTWSGQLFMEPTDEQLDVIISRVGGAWAA